MNLLIISGMKKLLKTVNKLLFINFNRGGLILPLVLLILLFSSCGISVPYYLNPPAYHSNLSFYNAYINDPDYTLGYDFFYRIYDDSLISESTIISEANSYFTETNLLELLANNHAVLIDTYYRRILPISNDILTDYKIDETPIPTARTPIMPIDPYFFDQSADSSNRFLISINLNLLNPEDSQIFTTSYIPETSYPTTIYFKRYVTIDEVNFIDVLFSDIDINHDDVPDSTVSPIKITFFVVLYGITSDFTPIFSDILYIGSEIYTF